MCAARHLACSGTSRLASWRRRYFFLLFFLPAVAFLLVALAVFLGDFLAGLEADFLPALAVFVLDDERPPLKILSQLSEYCLVAPTRTTLMVVVGPFYLF